MFNRDRMLLVVLVGLAVIAASPDRAWAMHISEGILPAPWAALWWIAAVPFIWWGLRQVRIEGMRSPQFKPLVGLVGAGVFVISCMPIPVPIAGTCSHPCGTGLAAILIGPGPAIVVASIALTLEALFLAHGGLTTLGANVISMGVVGSFAGYATFKILRRLGVGWYAAVFAGGAIADWATYGVTAFILGAGIHGDGPMGATFLAILVAFVPTQLPLGIFEGFLSVGAYGFIRGRRPEMLRMFVGSSPGGDA